MSKGLKWLVEQWLALREPKKTITVAQAKKNVLTHLKEKGPTRLPKLQRLMQRNEGCTYQILRLMVRDKTLESVKLNQYLTYYRLPGDKRAFKD